MEVELVGYGECDNVRLKFGVENLHETVTPPLMTGKCHGRGPGTWMTSSTRSVRTTHQRRADPWMGYGIHEILKFKKVVQCL